MKVPSLAVWLWLVSALIVGVTLGVFLGYSIESLIRCSLPRTFCAGYWWQFGAVWGAL